MCQEIAKLGDILTWGEHNPELAIQKMLDTLPRILDLVAGIDLPDIECEDDVFKIYQPRLDGFIEQICLGMLQQVTTTEADGADFLRDMTSSVKLTLQARSYHWIAEAFAKINSSPQAAIATPGTEAIASHPELLAGPTVNRKLAAKALGVSERTLDRWVESGKITPIKVGGRIRFDSEELKRILSPSKPDQQ